jgi:hypothetical protein
MGRVACGPGEEAFVIVIAKSKFSNAVRKEAAAKTLKAQEAQAAKQKVLADGADSGREAKCPCTKFLATSDKHPWEQIELTNTELCA